MSVTKRMGRALILLGLALLAPLALIATALLVAVASEGRMDRALRGLDQFCNAALFNGSQHETVSSHVGRVRGALWACALRALLDTIDPGHCARAAASEAGLLAAISLHFKSNESTYG